MKTPHCIGIVGAGAVGSAVALSILHHNLADVCMYDVDHEKCKGEVLDLQDAAFVSGVRVSACTDLQAMSATCDIVVVTAGAKQAPGEPRTNLISRNARILESVFSQLCPLRPETVVLVVSNPVDVLTLLAQRMLPLPRSQVIGSGTYLDSQRLRVAISQEIGVGVKSVHAYVLGEHGDSQFAAYGAAKVGGCDLSCFESMTPDKMAAIERSVSRKAYDIIERKGATCHGIGAVASAICDCILHDKKEAMPLSAYVPSLDACVGWPVVLGRRGVEQLLPMPLSSDEQDRLRQSAAALRAVVDQQFVAAS